MNTRWPDRSPASTAAPVWGALLAGLMLALSAPAAWAQENDDRPRFKVIEASTRLVDEVFFLDARIAFDFNAEAIEALDHGVPLTVELQIEVLETRDLLWDSTTATLNQYYRIEYRALVTQYLVTNLNTGELSSHTNLEAALAMLGQVTEFPMLDRRLLRVGARYSARLRARLDVESLPLPLRPMVYLKSRWGLTSEWYEWPLTP